MPSRRKREDAAVGHVIMPGQVRRDLSTTLGIGPRSVKPGIRWIEAELAALAVAGQGPTATGMRCCGKCREVRPVSDFGPDKRASDGLTHQCRSCFAAYREANREKLAAHGRAYRAENREEISARRRARYQERREEERQRARAFYQEHREEVKARAAAWQQEHREERREYNRRYHEEHHEEHREYQQIYAEVYREEILARKRASYQRHREKARAEQHAYKRARRITEAASRIVITAPELRKAARLFHVPVPDAKLLLAAAVLKWRRPASKGS